jgi:hypothetical protein
MELWLGMAAVITILVLAVEEARTYRRLPRVINRLRRRNR